MTTPLRSSDMLAGTYDKRGCKVHQERATRETNRLPVVDTKADTEEVDPLTERTCIEAFCLNEHDALPDTVRIESSPAVTYGGGYGACNIWLQNTILILAGLVAVALGCGLAYLVIGGWEELVNGFRALSFW